MAKPEKLDDFEIAGHWLSALINGDYSGLSDDECTQVDEWQESTRDGQIILFGEIPESPEFTRDAISGLMADCYFVRVFLQ